MTDGNMFKCTTWVPTDFCTEYQRGGRTFTIHMNFEHATAVREIRSADDERIEQTDNLGILLKGDKLFFWSTRDDKNCWQVFEPQVQEKFREFVAEKLLLEGKGEDNE